jgi:hypothetical protein
MILPTKHIPHSRSLLGQAHLVLNLLRSDKPLTELWDEAREFPEIGSFHRFVLALDLLFALGVVQFDGNVLRSRLPT